MSFDNYKDADNIYHLTTNLKSQGWIWETTPLLLAGTVKNDVPEIERTARLHTGDMPIFNINNNLSYQKNCAFVADAPANSSFQYTSFIPLSNLLFCERISVRLCRYKMVIVVMDKIISWLGTNNRAAISCNKWV